MKRKPTPDPQPNLPIRLPDWRWRRAKQLAYGPFYFSKKRDDAPTGVAMQYMRELNQARSESKQLRIKKRYSYLTEAYFLYQSWLRSRLEIEARLLAGQSDMAIALAMKIPPPTVQAYRDLFYHIEDRLLASTYISQVVIGVRPGQQPTDEQLFKLQAYSHGPQVIPVWLDYLAEGWDGSSLDTERDRSMATIWFYVQSTRLPSADLSPRDLARQLTLLTKNRANSVLSIPAGQAFAQTFTHALRESLPPAASLPPLSYAPAPSRRGRPPKKPQTVQFRRAA